MERASALSWEHNSSIRLINISNHDNTPSQRLVHLSLTMWLTKLGLAATQCMSIPTLYIFFKRQSNKLRPGAAVQTTKQLQRGE